MPGEIDKLWAEGVAWLKGAGAEIVEVLLPHTHHALATYYIVAPAEAYSNIARHDGVRDGLRVSPDQGSLDEIGRASCRARGSQTCISPLWPFIYTNQDKKYKINELT